MKLISMAKARNFGVRPVISDREVDMVAAINRGHRCHIVRVFVHYSRGE